MSEMATMNFSTAAKAFDLVARSYDESFTRSTIGQAQRRQVWQRLLQSFAPGRRILELNCGTGEDARFLARQGRSIVACDASAEMIGIAAARTELEASGADITFQWLANEHLSSLLGQNHFDGAFSNFSGLNCASDLRPIASNLASLVRPGGRVLLCMWSRMCVWEIAWHLLRGQRYKTFRRFSARTTARIGELIIPVFYHAVRQVQRAFTPWFALERRRAIGLFVPPSYMEGWARKHEAALRHLEHLDEIFAGWPALRDVGDHVLLEFTRCSH